MKYFAYGSNMSTKRLQQRVASAKPIGVYQLIHHKLKFHKEGHDGSAKGDAYATNNVEDIIYGVLFEIDEQEKYLLDQVEGLDNGYDIKWVELLAVKDSSEHTNQCVKAFTYYATQINTTLSPFDWYLQHVIVGAQEHQLPADYQTDLRAIETIEDPNSLRKNRELTIYTN
ncbi:gamma-glutamylcyclotransferase family protein [Thalassotalea ganghwensis]